MFFPVGDSRPAGVEQITQAKAVCRHCVVRAECLSFALVAISDGVAGGLTAEERAQLRRVSRVPASGKPRSGADELVVAALMEGRWVSGPSSLEVALAVVGLHEAGRGCRWIATHLRIDEWRVYRWVQRHRAGLPLVPQGARGAGVSA